MVNKAMSRRKKKSWMTPDAFRHVRESVLKLTQKELGDRLDTSDRQISQFETGRQPIPKDVAAVMMNAHAVGFKWPRKPLDK